MQAEPDDAAEQRASTDFDIRSYVIGRFGHQSVAISLLVSRNAADTFARLALPTHRCARRAHPAAMLARLEARLYRRT
jgi:hypothetical protein